MTMAQTIDFFHLYLECLSKQPMAEKIKLPFIVITSYSIHYTKLYEFRHDFRFRSFQLCWRLFVQHVRCAGGQAVEIGPAIGGHILVSVFRTFGAVTIAATTTAATAAAPAAALACRFGAIFGGCFAAFAFVFIRIVVCGFCVRVLVLKSVITSYSIHYTKLYDPQPA